MAMAALPAILGAGGAVGGGLLNYFGAKGASKLSPVEEASQRTSLGASQALTQQGGTLTAYGMPKLQQAGNYYSTLAGGNRAALSQAVAPDAANVNAVYGGTQRSLLRFLRGPDRDQQLGDLAREKSGQIASLYTGARERGMSGLLQLGQYGVSQGAESLTGGARVAAGVGDTAMRNRYAGADLQSQAGASTAGLIYELLKSGIFNTKRAAAAT